MLCNESHFTKAMTVFSATDKCEYVKQLVETQHDLLLPQIRPEILLAYPLNITLFKITAHFVL